MGARLAGYPGPHPPRWVHPTAFGPKEKLPLTKMKKSLQLRKQLCFRKATHTPPLVFPPGVPGWGCGSPWPWGWAGLPNPAPPPPYAPYHAPNSQWELVNRSQWELGQPLRRQKEASGGRGWALNSGLLPTGPVSLWSAHPCLILIVEGGSGLLFQPSGQLVQ